MAPPPAEAKGAMRADKWLWMARFFRSRSLAAEALAGRAVRINGQKTDRPAHPLRPGDVLTFAQGAAVRVVRVTALPSRRGPAAEAQGCYADLSPPAGLGAEAAGDLGGDPGGDPAGDPAGKAMLEPLAPLA